jgi:hypothetical protein
MRWVRRRGRALRRVASDAAGSRVTMERYAHVTAAQQRQAADLLELAVTGLPALAESVTESVTVSVRGVANSRAQESGVGPPLGEVGSGGRTRTYDQAVNSRPLYH